MVCAALLLATALPPAPASATVGGVLGGDAAVEEEPAGPEAGSIEVEQAEGDDERIEARLTDIFANVPSLQGVTVDVNEGVVTLGGTVPDDEAAARAESIATGVDGVVTVENGAERDVSVDVAGGIGGLGDRFEDFTRMLPLIGAALLTAAVIIAFGYLLASFGGLWRRVAPNSFLAELIVSAIRFTFVIIGIVVALDMVGAGALMGAVLGGAGVIGLALGFAMRDTVENYVASLMLSLRQPFRANDHIIIDNTHEGRVISLTSRATVMLTLDGNHLRIPNSTVFKGTILNFTRNPQRRFQFVLGVDADDDAEAARRLGKETLAAMPFVLDDPAPEVRITEVGDSNVVLQFLGWVDQRETNWFKANTRAIAVCKAALEEAGFALPEPIYRLRFDQRTASLPFLNVGEKDGSTSASSPAPTQDAKPAPSPDKLRLDASAPLDTEATGEDEIVRMVEEERAESDTQQKDLLDNSRPVE
ncbi:MscS mechanosensitive ion channel [Aurantiacibacter gangjinensis]|uniref:Small-conductance mechanosensitive channel n=1 Tax=Aurantiacibacter gangjinensis TaxID=502682 RepID=A0A0G9MNF9_9SPHN|nr:MscS mechanosensitive ion channel [Aurantiacibacter gangjinensis]